MSALGLQRVLGLGSYKTAWAMLHKLRRAMVRPGRDRLDGVVEVDEAYWGGEETGAIGRGAEEKALIIVAAEEDGKGIGPIRLRMIPDASSASLHGFIPFSINPFPQIKLEVCHLLSNRGHECGRQSYEPVPVRDTPNMQRRTPKFSHFDFIHRWVFQRALC
jgi:hypothetical protein